MNIFSLHNLNFDFYDRTNIFSRIWRAIILKIVGFSIYTILRELFFERKCWWFLRIKIEFSEENVFFSLKHKIKLKEKRIIPLIKWKYEIQFKQCLCISAKLHNYYITKSVMKVVQIVLCVIERLAIIAKVLHQQNLKQHIKISERKFNLLCGKCEKCAKKYAGK